MTCLLDTYNVCVWQDHTLEMRINLSTQVKMCALVAGKFNDTTLEPTFFFVSFNLHLSNFILKYLLSKCCRIFYVPWQEEIDVHPFTIIIESASCMFRLQRYTKNCTLRIPSRYWNNLFLIDLNLLYAVSWHSKASHFISMVENEIKAIDINSILGGENVERR